METMATASPADLEGLFFQEAFVLQASYTPQATALIELQGTHDNLVESRSISYQELDQKTNQLGHWLLGEGVGPNIVVALMMPRSIELVTAVLGVLKAGGTCLVLDPRDPVERRLACITQAQVKHILVDEKRDEIGGEAAVWSCSEVEARMAGESITCPEITQRRSDLAYVCFTSGTTGQPKGILIPHAGRDAKWVTTFSDTPLAPGEFGVSKASMSTTLFYHEFHTSLLTGGTVVIVPPEKDREVPYLFAVLEHYRIPVVNLTPSLLRAMMEWRDVAHLSHLRAVITYGEGLPGEVEDVFYRSNPAELVVYYGCTEATSAVCSRRRKRPSQEGVIGTPTFFRSVYILDDALQPVSGMEVGQVVIGRPSAAGYLNDPEGTAKRFVPDPFSSDPQAVMFLTGDRARWLSDGTIQLLGREDSLVKLRGYRVELGEIELALKQMNEVENVCVKTITDLSGEHVLVAYLTSSLSRPVPGDVLRQRLGQQLPEHMIPSTFMWVDEFPLTPVGKVDKAALPLPAFMTAKPEVNDEALSNREKIMLAAWCRCLGVRSVSRDIHFFEAGGSSLKAVRLLAEIRKQFGQTLPVSALAANPTPADLLNQLEGLGEGSTSFHSLVPVKPTGARSPFFCVHAAHGDILGFSRLASHFNADQPFYGFQARGLDNEAPWPSSVEEMASNYIHELQQVAPTGPYYLGGRCYGSLVAVEMAHQLMGQGHDVPVLIVLDTLNAFGSDRSGSWRERIGHSPQEHLHWAHRILSHNMQRWKNRFRAKRNEYFRKMEALRRHHIMIRRAYSPPSFPGRIVYLECQQEHRHPAELKAWQTIAQQDVKVVQIPGRHNTMLKEPHVMEVAKIIQACL